MGIKIDVESIRVAREKVSQFARSLRHDGVPAAADDLDRIVAHGAFADNEITRLTDELAKVTRQRNIHPIWLEVFKGKYTVSIEVNGEWVNLIDTSGEVVSHIIEPEGIIKAIGALQTVGGE